ncbi:hypothetical protein ALQ26_200110 [Pseudomonas amygdali pv. lachrymans]|nr:hypothetical protein ALQ26_200110 [Pseudomonas amygdali pv. lachrymans]
MARHHQDCSTALVVPLFSVTNCSFWPFCRCRSEGFEINEILSPLQFPLSGKTGIYAVETHLIKQ